MNKLIIINTFNNTFYNMRICINIFVKWKDPNKPPSALLNKNIP